MNDSTLDGKQARKLLRKAQREVSDLILEDKEQLDKPDSGDFLEQILVLISCFN